MTARIVVYFSPKRPEEQGILAGVNSYVREHALPWEVIPCLDFTKYSDRSLIENLAPPAVIIGRPPQLALIHSLREKGIWWVDWPYSTTPSEGDSWVMFDPQSIGRVAANFFLTHGVRTFAVKGPIPSQVEEQEARIRAFMQTIEASGHACHILCSQGQCEADHIAELQHMCQSTAAPVGFFLMNDDNATYMTHILEEASVPIPQRAMVIGGSSNALSAFKRISLSTVRLPFFALGRTAALQAHRLLSGAEAPPVMIPVIGIIERDTTRCHITVEDTVVQRALRFVEETHRDIPTVTQLAKHCGVDPLELLRRFKQSIGFTPKRWLMEQAMQRAIHLLADTEQPLDVIAKQCGFHHLSTFIHRFKASFTITPARYRQQWQ